VKQYIDERKHKVLIVTMKKLDICYLLSGMLKQRIFRQASLTRSRRKIALQRILRPYFLTITCRMVRTRFHPFRKATITPKKSDMIHGDARQRPGQKKAYDGGVDLSSQTAQS